MTWGHLATFSTALTFWALSLAHKTWTSKIYIVTLLLFADLYGFAITANTIIFQFLAIRTYNNEDYPHLPEMEIWGFFGIYATS